MRRNDGCNTTNLNLSNGSSTHLDDSWLTAVDGVATEEDIPFDGA
ncbi:MAG: hypothetical protein ACOX2O_07175 [Bdellovibrionota bacterium]